MAASSLTACAMLNIASWPKLLPSAGLLVAILVCPRPAGGVGAGVGVGVGGAGDGGRGLRLQGTLWHAYQRRVVVLPAALHALFNA